MAAGRMAVLCVAAGDRRAPAFPGPDRHEFRPAALPDDLAGRLGAGARLIASPSLVVAAAESAPALAEPDFGRWAGRRLTDVLAEEADAFARFRCEAEAAPHGGESLAAFGARIGRWLEDEGARPGDRVVLAGPMALCAALAGVLGAPIGAIWTIDAADGSRIALHHDGRRWAVRL